MQLLPLLLPVLLCLVVFISSQETSTRGGRHGWKDRLQRRFGNLTEEQRQKMRKNWGSRIDPEARKARLERLHARKNRTLTPEAKAELDQRLAKLVVIKPDQKPNEQEPIDLFDVNNREGVSQYYFQGDMHLTEEQLSTVEQTSDDESHRAKRQASTVFKKWTDNTLYFYFDSSANARKIASVTAAHQYISSRTCIKFVQSSTATNRVKVFSGSGCYSSIGMVGGEQQLSLGDGCEVIGTSAHEFTHALGVWHSQMRSDRDTYVTIDMTNVPTNYQGNFDKLTASQNFIYTPYEYGSFMHYGSNSFTNPSDKLSIVPKDMKYAYTMGNRQISFYDIMMLNQYYGCDAKCPTATSAQCKNGGMPNPNNCATCNCPLGYEGTLCDQRPAGCGEALTATTTWQSKSYSFGDTADNQNVRDTFTLCNHWITAPAGNTIQVQITSMFNPQCQYGCPFNGIEVKGIADQRMTNPRYCCPEFNNQIINSTLNPTPIISFNRYYYTSFTIQYRYVPATATAATTTAVPAPTTTTTKAAVVTTAKSSTCKSMNTPESCASLVSSGFCTNTAQYSFQTIKYNCAVECGLCGKAASDCVDTNTSCAGLLAAGYCTSYDPMVMESNCAKTCGFCTKPN